MRETSVWKNIIVSKKKKKVSSGVNNRETN